MSDPTITDDFVAYLHRVEGGEEHRGADGRWYPYNTDGAGKWTIGRGHLINGGRSPAGFEQGLTDEEVEELFRADVEDAMHAARAAVGGRTFDHLATRDRQLLTDFAFNLGPGFVNEFPKMVTAILAGQRDTALAEVDRFRRDPSSGEKKPLVHRNAEAKRFFFGVDPDATNEVPTR